MSARGRLFHHHSDTIMCDMVLFNLFFFSAFTLLLSLLLFPFPRLGNLMRTPLLMLMLMLEGMMQCVPCPVNYIIVVHNGH